MPIKFRRKKKVDLEGIKNEIIEVLRTIFDPEIPVNIYDLGLVYNIILNEEGDQVKIEMTLTSPHCPVAQTFPGTVETSVKEGVKNLKEVTVELVWDPPWSQESMSEAAKLQLGLY